MKLLTLAVASIVDANLNQGHTQHVIGYSSEKISAHLDQGRIIRSRSVRSLFHGTVQAVHTILEKLKSELQRRKDIAQLSSLSEHLLNDVGFSLNDIESLKSGAISIEALNARRRSNTVTEKIPEAVKSVSKTTDLGNLECANEESLGLSKCA